jgi:hypothetical protein
VSFGERGARLRRRMLQGLPTTLWMWKTLPLAAFAGLRIIELDEACCTVGLPCGWRTQNPFRSTYFAAQAMAAEMSTGAPAMVLLADAPASIAMLVVSLRATYQKKIVGPSTFRFEHVAAMKSTIEEAAAADEPRTFLARSIGRDRGGDFCAEFEVTWSFKRRSRG